MKQAKTTAEFKAAIKESGLPVTYAGYQVIPNGMQEIALKVLSKHFVMKPENMILNIFAKGISGELKTIEGYLTQEEKQILKPFLK